MPLKRLLLIVGTQTQSPGSRQALGEVLIAFSDLGPIPVENMLTRQCRWELCGHNLREGGGLQMGHCQLRTRGDGPGEN